MSAAAICGSKRYYDFFDDLTPSSTPPVTKKLRCGSASPSPSRLSPPRDGLLHRLNSLFPTADPQLLERALDESGNDLESAIRRVRELSCTSAEEAGGTEFDQQGSLPQPGNCDVATDFDTTLSSNQIVECAQWVDLFVAEMMSATSVDDARSRATKLLENLGKSFLVQAAEEAVQGVQKENVMLKEQIQELIRENSILKRAVAIQYERQKEFENKDHELHQLKEMVSQYQQQLRTLEVNNYALRMQLRQAELSSPVMGHFNRDVF